MPLINDLKNALNPRLRRFLHLGTQLALDPLRKHFRCPICSYRGPFLDANFHVLVYATPQTDAMCPSCGGFERHRMQRLIFEELSKTNDFSGKTLLHMAPETCNQDFFRGLFGKYVTADLYMDGVDIKLDLTKNDLPAEFDAVIATHVLEHIEDDAAAIAGIRRILRPGGFAVLPVPIVIDKTVEYHKANGGEFGHVRACGVDFFDRYRPHFNAVKVYESKDFSEIHQLYLIQDRTHWPPPNVPWLKPVAGQRHADYAPVCFV